MKKVDSLIGLAMKAGKLVSGEFSVENAIRDEQVLLVIIAEDASKNTKKKFTNMCNFRKVPMYMYETKTYLGGLIGKEFRASLAVVDAGFANSIIKQLDSK